MSTITTRSGKGSPLTNNEIDDNFTNLNTDKYQSGDSPSFAGLTTTADINFGDNDKAIFGDGSDLQIYHDGAQSYIKDTGTGQLRIAVSDILISNADITENIMFGTQNGAVTLYYDGAAKLATTTTGIDVTGTAEMDTLSIGGTAVTSTAAELNILDGVTATAAELNILDGVTATAAELNYNDITTLGQVEASKTVTADASANVTWGDNEKAVFGAGSDLQIYHTGSQSVIYDAGTGLLNLTTNGSEILLEKEGGDDLARFITDGAVELFYAGAQKLATTTSGITVTGAVTADGLFVGDNDYIYVGSGNDLQIYHDGSNSYIDDAFTGTLRIRGNTAVYIQKYTGESIANFNADGAVDLYYDNALKLATTADGISVTGKIYASSYMGLDSGDFLSWADNTYLDVTINGNHKFRFEADGDLHADGDVIAYSTTVSDSRLKDNIQNIEGALAKVNSINGVTFIRKNNGEKAAGVIAQDIIEVLPEAVKEKSLPLQTGTDDKYYVVEYDAVTGLLVEAIKELTKRVEALEK